MVLKFMVGNVVLGSGQGAGCCEHGNEHCGSIKFGRFLDCLTLFMPKGWDYVSELRPPVGLLFIHRVIHEYGEPRWNDTDRGEQKNSKKNLSQCHFVYQRSHMDWPGRERWSLQWKSSDYLPELCHSPSALTVRFLSKTVLYWDGRRTCSVLGGRERIVFGPKAVKWKSI
jgi:hypothetical protein